MAKDEARKLRALPDDAELEVPAAILCATCGRSDCAGCAPELADTDAGSGIVAIVPWERPGGAWTRLFATANATTRGAAPFFGALPDGPVAPALRFAVFAEMAAVASVFAVGVPVAAFALPRFAVAVLSDPARRAAAVGWIGVLVPALALWMVAAHMVHGVALGRGAERGGGRPVRRRSVRFGLYACGWDLMSAPVGLVVTLLSRGPRAAAQLFAASVAAPRIASEAFLDGAAAVPEAGKAKARRAGTVSAVLIALVSGAAVVAFAVALALL